MGRFLRQYDKDYMKMAMLKQEETFREQVNELHRLYRVQKLLMRDVTRDAELHAGRQSPRRMLPPDEEAAADVELTLATGAWRKKADSDDSGSGASFSSSASTESGSARSGGETLDVRDWGLWYRRAPVVEGQGPVAVAVRQGLADQRPPWQMHHLSLNMT